VFEREVLFLLAGLDTSMVKFVINYNLGQDMVRTYIEARGGLPDHPERRWKEFSKLLSSPRVPSGLAVEV
jgi:hypothetical protein